MDGSTDVDADTVILGQKLVAVFGTKTTVTLIWTLVDCPNGNGG